MPARQSGLCGGMVLTLSHSPEPSAGLHPTVNILKAKQLLWFPLCVNTLCRLLYVRPGSRQRCRGHMFVCCLN